MQVIYSLLCERQEIVDIDYNQDLKELKKLNIIQIENEYIRISNYISSSVIRRCQDELMEKDSVRLDLFDALMFKNIIELGLKDGLLAYSETTESKIDYAFVKVLVLTNQMQYPNDIRFNLLEKYLLQILDDINSVRDLYRESCKYFEISVVESRFVFWSKKLGFIIPELINKRDVHVDEEEISTEYYLQEIINEFGVQLDAIDEFIIKRKKGASQSYCLDTMQGIRGRLGSICNVKLARVFSLNLEGCNEKLQEVKEMMDDISYTPEFSMKEYEQYKHLMELLA